MELAQNGSLKIKIDNYSGPLEVLLDLAKLQKVNLTDISITQLADDDLIIYGCKLSEYPNPK